jgi:hypothetical protein
MNGPFPASKCDYDIFTKEGLMDRMPTGSKAISDKGYVGDASKGPNAKLSVPNSHDTPEVSKFKGRAKARQESFNARIKKFKCLDERFRRGTVKHKAVFEAVCVITQYSLENGSPLFDV